MRRIALFARQPLIAGLVFCAVWLLSPRILSAQSPPTVVVTERDLYILYEPALTTKFNAKTMPLVVYLHGAPLFVEPDFYDRMLTDLAASGCSVVLPVWDAVGDWSDTDWTDPDVLPTSWYGNAVERTRIALADIYNRRVGLWRPPLWNLALVGHSLGGTYALKMADEANDSSLGAEFRLPVSPRLIVLHDAAGFNTLLATTPPPHGPEWFASLDGIRDDASLVVIGSVDSVLAHIFANDINATGIWSRAWKRSGPLASKRSYLALGSHYDVYGPGDYGIYGSGDYALYRDVTIHALKAKFSGGPTADPAPDRRLDWFLNPLNL
jgi:hypothetical protein